MSIIITYFNANRAYVFSEGRLTTDTSICTDSYDKTLSLYKKTLICAYSGLLILNDSAGHKKDVRSEIQIIERVNPQIPFPQFIQLVQARISLLLQQTTVDYKAKTIILHFAWRGVQPNGNFEFRRITLTADPNNNITSTPKAFSGIDNSFFNDGHPSTYSPVSQYLNGKSCTTNAQLIKLNREAIKIGVKSSGTNLARQKSCGGKRYRKRLI